MNSVCLFASYFTGQDIPYYITIYLKELKRHFKEVVLLSSQKTLSEESLSFLHSQDIRLQVEENRGFDFGLWNKGLKKLNVQSYNTIALVNDSCILFKPLDEFMRWSEKQKTDFQGITKSEAIAPHLQSYFLIIRKSAIQHVADYLNQNGILENISDVIATYEVGLSTYLLSNGYTMAAYIDNDEYTGEFSPYYQCIDYHLSSGIPVIKKKILFSSYRPGELFTLARMNFNIDPAYYIDLIKRRNPDVLVDFKKLKNSETDSISGFQKIRYGINRVLILMFKKIKGS